MAAPSLSELFRTFLSIGLLSFGGPAAQIALLQHEIVTRRGWLDQDSFLRGLSFCMLLPGPEAMQLATFVGWKARGTIGGIIAGGLFVLPGACVIAALSALYVLFGTRADVQAAFVGIKAAVLVIVLMALWRLATQSLTSRQDGVLAALAFCALFALDIPFPLVVLAAGLWGAWRGADTASSAPSAPPNADTLKVVAVWGALWLAPLIALAAAGETMLFDLALFFGQLAITTFGGAYAVLAYMTQGVVETHGWITADQMIDALGLAETTPGPLILVTQFVGHLAGHGSGGWLLWASAGAVSLWMTFIPCFLWIFAGAPYLEAIMARPRLSAALHAIKSAVVGVMASLAIWFGLHVLFEQHGTFAWGAIDLEWPHSGSLSWSALLCLTLAAALLWGRNWPILWVLPLAAIAGLGTGLAGL